jgi:hypothetical protein
MMYRPKLTWMIGIVVVLAASAGSHQEAGKQEAGSAAVPAKVVFIKEFPRSLPDYYSVSVTEKGEAVYSTAADDPQPLRFRLSEATTREIFQLVDRLNRFQGVELETRKKVAAMGKKTLRYEAGGKRNEAGFNYSENPDAMALAGLFEKISATEQLLLNLERVSRFEKLGIMKELLQMETAMNKKELVEPSQFVPLLEEIAGNQSYLHMAQERARYLLQRIKNEK